MLLPIWIKLQQASNIGRATAAKTGSALQNKRIYYQHRNDGLLATLIQCSTVPTYSHDIYMYFMNEPDDITRTSGNEYHDGIPFSEYLTRKYLGCNEINTTGATSGTRTAYTSRTPELYPGFSGVRVTRSLVLCVMFYRSLFVLLSFFFWPLCCLSFFNLRIWIIPLGSSNSS